MHVYICIVYMCVARVCIYVYVCICICMYISVCVYMCVARVCMYVYVYVCICVCVCVHLRRPEEALVHLELMVVGSHSKQMLGAKSRSSARTVRAFDHHAVSLAPCKMFLKLIAKDLKDQGSPGLSSVNC